MSYKLYHGKSPTEENIIYDNIIDRENLNLKMDEFLNKINYRTWSVNGYTYIDYGSHFNYFITDLNLMKEN